MGTERRPRRPISEYSNESLRRRDPHVPVQFRTQGVGLLRRAVAADLAEHGAVLADRHILWRGWQEHLRVAQPAGFGSDPRGTRPGVERTSSWANRRRAVRHAAPERNPGAYP